MTLRERRLAADLTQQQVADVLGVSRAHYAKLELGLKRLIVRHREALYWRYGWLSIRERSPLRLKRRHMVSSPKVNLAAQARLLALLGLAELKAKGSEIPQDWRDRWRHRRLWTDAICAASQQVRRMGRGCAA